MEPQQARVHWGSLLWDWHSCWRNERRCPQKTHNVTVFSCQQTAPFLSLNSALKRPKSALSGGQQKAPPLLQGVGEAHQREWKDYTGSFIGRNIAVWFIPLQRITAIYGKLTSFFFLRRQTTLKAVTSWRLHYRCCAGGWGNSWLSPEERWDLLQHTRGENRLKQILVFLFH